MTRLFIREAVPEHRAALLSIERSNPLAAHWSSAEYERLFAPEAASRVALVAARATEIVGFAIAREVASEWELENIAVLPNVHGQGIGFSLLEALLTKLENAGGTKLMLEVRESNHAARRLYEKVGMMLAGRRKSYYADPSEDALLFEKNLPKSV